MRSAMSDTAYLFEKYLDGLELYSASKSKEAIELLEIQVEETWTCLLQCNSKYNVCDKYMVAKLFKHAERVFCLLLHIYVAETLRMKLIDFLKRWHTAQCLFGNIHPPKKAIKEWIQISLAKIKQTEEGDRVDILCSLMPSVEQELENRQDIKYSSTKWIHSAISDILLDEIYRAKGLRKYSDEVEEAMDLLQKRMKDLLAKKERDCKSSSGEFLLQQELYMQLYGDYFKQCTESLSTIIDNMNACQTNEKCGLFSNLLAKAYCLLALCQKEARFNSQKIIQSIRQAFKLWMSEPYGLFVNKSHLVSSDMLTLLCHVNDLLSLLEECSENHYEMMIRTCKLKRMNLHDCVRLFLQSKCVKHCLCLSPTRETFFVLLSKFYETQHESETTKFWIECMDGLEPETSLLTSLFSSMPTLSTSCSLKSHEHSSPMPAYEARFPDKASFLKSHIFYRTAERSFSRGAMFEALSSAKESCRLLKDLLMRKFRYIWQHENGSIFEDEVLYDPKIRLKSFNLCISTLESWSSSDIEDYITPYDVLRCYLESTIQLGTIQEILLDEKAAISVFSLGKNISIFLGLPSYVIKFSCGLGNIYCKQQKWKLAKEELDYAGDVFKTEGSFPCSVRLTLLGVTISQALGDLLSATGNEGKNLEEATEYFQSATINMQHGLTSCDARLSKKAIDICEFYENGSLENFLDMKLLSSHIRIRHGLLMRLGSLMAITGKTTNAQEVFSVSFSSFIRTNQNQAASFTDLEDLIERDVVPSPFAIEYSSLLYTIGWYSLKWSYIKGERNHRNEMFLPIPTIALGLKKAFIMSHEVPQLFKKVAQLLAVLYTVSSTSNTFLTHSSISTPSLCEWAAFFLQSSIGLHVDCELASNKAINESSSNKVINENSSAAPDSIAELESFVSRAFEGLPDATVVCLTVLDNQYADLLADMLPTCLSPLAWLMMARFSGDKKRAVLLLPISSAIEARPNDVLPEVLKEPDLIWKCPWGHTAVDDLAPLLRVIVEGCGSFSSSFHPSYNRLFNQWMKHITESIERLLRHLEEDWFGSFKELLLGKRVDQEESFSHLGLKFGCFVGVGNLSSEEPPLKKIRVDERKRLKKKRVDEDRRLPVILVLDSNIQMLPFESMELLYYQEVYRMPSLASIRSTRCKRDPIDIPWIDPLNSYYLVNPDGDLLVTENRFKHYFGHLKKGIYGSAPYSNVLLNAIEDQELFIYWGHGSGMQYISRTDFRKLHECAAAFLMGCSSNVLFFSGPYLPLGAPVSYIVGGSPIVMGNLWDVTCDPLDFLSIKLLEACLEARDKSNKKNIGSFMGDARDACGTLLVASALVCYGVPTCIWKTRR